ncbi:GNAT family N-acetyltransferase [Paenibacillus sp. DMB20]|uniref:GNAT family N-acetyltransferase n=1 Tax=Paenibacillus sp. DMB20 TaxID=1642570 RepID=UPI0006275EB8|nr:GNAT family N-acetyltransferase [Paenibacillus sp. DMB20]KKO53859.1 GCN5 family acetyltransferase [Paenibacillus sp. DMB20]
MKLSPWSIEQKTYPLSDEFRLQKADKAEWGIFCSVYYSSEYNGFFKEQVYDFQLRRDPFWIYKGEDKVGGVVIEPNVLYLLFFIPPFNEEGMVLKILKNALIQWSDSSKPIIVYEILPEQADLFARAGFWPDEFRCRWMQRPTEAFTVDWDGELIVIEPKIRTENEDKKLIDQDEITKFFYECNIGRIDAVRRKQETVDSYISMIGSYPYLTNKVCLNASSLVYEKQTNKLVGACLVSLEGTFSAVYEIAVMPGFHGRGIATKMLKRALTGLKDHYPVLRLYVMQGNTAESVYYNLGFMPGPLEVQKFHLPHKMD